MPVTKKANFFKKQILKDSNADKKLREEKKKAERQKRRKSQSVTRGERGKVTEEVVQVQCEREAKMMRQTCTQTDGECITQWGL